MQLRTVDCPQTCVITRPFGPPAKRACARWVRQAAAQEFCARHELPPEVVAPLAEHLAANLERIPIAEVGLW